MLSSISQTFRKYFLSFCSGLESKGRENTFLRKPNFWDDVAWIRRVCTARWSCRKRRTSLFLGGVQRTRECSVCTVQREGTTWPEDQKSETSPVSFAGVDFCGGSFRVLLYGILQGVTGRNFWLRYLKQWCIIALIKHSISFKNYEILWKKYCF